VTGNKTPMVLSTKKAIWDQTKFVAVVAPWLQVAVSTGVGSDWKKMIGELTLVDFKCIVFSGLSFLLLTLCLDSRKQGSYKIPVA
jgi:hypothetical protein